MKKILALLWLLILILTMTACGNDISSADATITTTTPSKDISIVNKEDDYGYFKVPRNDIPKESYGSIPNDFDISIFPFASDDIAEMASIYSADVQKRLRNIYDNKNVYFTNIAECELLSYNNGMFYDFSMDRTRLYGYISSGDGKFIDWYYPIVYQDTHNKVWVYYLTESGVLTRSPLITGYYSYSQKLCNVHNVDADENDFLDINLHYVVVLDDETSILSVWRFGQKYCEHELPEGANYVGTSEYVGYLFRVGNEIYSLPDSESAVGTHDFTLIASDVMHVIDPNYVVDNYGLPLFQMLDNSVKFYNPWTKDTQDIADSLHYVSNEEFDR